MKLKKNLLNFLFLLVYTINYSQQIGDGFAPIINNLTIPLKSGVYNGLNATGAAPDGGTGWQHLFVMRHSNVNNNHQLQLASSFSSNDRLFFRKIAVGDLNPTNPNWFELATRGVNTFTGNQIIQGGLTSSIGNNEGGFISINNPTKTSTGIGSSWKIYNMTGTYGNSLQFYVYDNLGCVTGGLCAPRMTLLDNGKVGIGTTMPTAQLEVNGDTKINGNLTLINAANKIVGFGDSANYYLGHFPVTGSSGLDIHWYGGMRFGDATSNSVMQITNGNVGIGTATPANPLTVQKVSGGTGLSGTDGKGGVRVNWSSGYGVALDAWDGNEPRWGITSFIANTPIVMLEGRYTSKDVYFNSGGNVGIGTANPDEKLAVNGNIHAKEVRVDLSGWPDYVFQKYYTGKSELKSDYKLPTLAEIEDFTKKNHHLPNVPSAVTIQEKGLQLGEMSNVLLQKIEELTLYAIEQDKKTIEQQKEIESLKKENEQYKSLVERVAALEKK